MRDAHLQRLMQEVLSTEPDELDCEGLRSIIDLHVDHLASTPGPVSFPPDIALHLSHCPDCLDVLESLVEIARMEASDGLPPVDRLWTEIEGATRWVPPPDRSGAAALPPKPASDRRERLARWLIPAGPPVLARALPRPAFALAYGCAVLALAFGWWRADNQADEARSALLTAQAEVATTASRADQIERVVKALSQSEHERFKPIGDGPWVRVFFGPDRRQAVVFAGDLPGGQKPECWLKKAREQARLAGQIELAARRPLAYWLFESEEPWESGEAVMLRNAAASNGLIEVGLEPEPAP